MVKKLWIESDSKFVSILLILFSILLAFGRWNPFVEYSENNDGFDLSQIYSVFFIGYLFFHIGLKKTKLVYTQWKPFIVLLYLLLIFSTILWSIDDINMSFVLFFGKLFLAMSLCFLLPEVFIRNEKSLYYSIASFSISCALIALLFILGYLENYTSFRGGRLNIFGENPNSTSGRIVIASVLLLYLIIENPLHWKKIRYLLILLFFPMLGMVIASGSRGSFILLFFCVIGYLFLDQRIVY